MIARESRVVAQSFLLTSNAAERLILYTAQHDEDIYIYRQEVSICMCMCKEEEKHQTMP